MAGRTRTTSNGYGTDPVFAANVRDNKEGLYPWGYVKWTSTLSSRLLLEAGWSWSVYAKTTDQKPYNDLPPQLENGQVNPDWIRNARRSDSALNRNPYCTLPDGCLVWWTGGQNAQQINARYPISASASYVTGSHNLKAGFSWSFGPDRTHTSRQADLTQNYVNGQPQSVTVTSTPMYVNAYMARDLGFFVQDTWTVKRLTVNPGVRVEYFNARMNEISVPAGRFVPARFFPEEKNLPNWKNDVAPRISVAYDLFGTGKTALKSSWSKYYATDRTRFAALYAKAGLVNESRNWFDCALNAAGNACSGVVLPTNRDDIAQDHEIGPSGQANFGTRAARGYDPDIQRSSNVEITAGVNHEVMPRIAVGVFYYHRDFQNLTSADRVQITDADYTSFQTRMPNFSNDPTLTGLLDPNEILTIYNLNTAKRPVFGEIVDRNGANNSIYDGFETSFTARLPNGASVYGGWTIERMVGKYCDNNDNPNGSTVTTEFGNVIANGGRFCDESQFNIPFRSDVKLAGSTPLRWGVNFGAVLQTYPGAERVITWSPPASVFPNGQRTNAETVILSTPGTVFQPRYNQLDVNFRKNFRSGTKVFSVQFDIFNVTNSSSILTTNNSIGSSLGEIQSILKGRMPRVAFQMKF